VTPESARIALAVPNLNQGRFLEAALDSIRTARGLVATGVLDAGSQDESRQILEARAGDLAFWRSGPDAGQAAAVNEGITRLCRDAPDIEAVGWLNADDFFLDDGLRRMWRALVEHPEWVAVAGRGALANERGQVVDEIPTAPFDRERFAKMCTICQPASLVRRAVWEQVGGLDASLDMCFDYDLWWRVSRLGTIGYLDTRVAASRDHGETKTRRRRGRYFEEGKAIVRRETGGVPWHWFISEALERQVDFEMNRRPGTLGRIAAALAALAAYLRARRQGAAA
jgi:GT2 family glycosyltransferase